MGAWDVYEARRDVYGPSKREMWVESLQASLADRMLNSPSYHIVNINGIEQKVAITHRTNLSEKKIFSFPGEHLKHGGLVEFETSKWLITELDADNEIHDKGIMKRCNHLLRWIGRDGHLREKWCIVEDGTKYLIGEASSRYDNLMVIGDARIAITIGKDEDTVQLTRGLRFLVDDTDVDDPLAYEITKPNRFFNNYEDEGVFRFILNEVVRNKGDHLSEQIADYTTWMPPRETDGDHIDSDCTVAEIVSEAVDKVEFDPPRDDKRGWL